MKKILAIIILLFPILVFSGSPVIIDQETENFLENLGNSSNDQRVINNIFDQKKNRHLLDSNNKRNNPIAQYGSQYVQDSFNKRNNPVRKKSNLSSIDKSQYIQDSNNKRNNPIAKYGEQYLKDSMNNQNNLVRRYGTIDKNDTVTNPFYNTSAPVRMKTLYSW